MEGQQTQISCLNLSGWDDSCKKEILLRYHSTLQYNNIVYVLTSTLYHFLSFHFATRCKTAWHKGQLQHQHEKNSDCRMFLLVFKPRRQETQRAFCFLRARSCLCVSMFLYRNKKLPQLMRKLQFN